MNKTIITIIFLAILAILGFMAWGYGRAGAPSGAPAASAAPAALTVSETHYDFGTISMANGVVTHVFRISNPTGKDVEVRDVQTSCMCTTAYVVDGASRMGPFGMPGMGGATATDFTVPAGGTKDVEVEFNPAAHGPAGVGNIDRVVSVTDAEGRVLQFQIMAVVTP